MKAVNFLLLRTEGPGDINEATLPESKLTVPVIQPQKLTAVVRRRMLQVLRMYRDSGADLKKFIDKARGLGFKKAEEHASSGWECTIQPPIASSGEKSTDIGMDGYCPACTIFGTALTSDQLSGISNMSLGIKTRVHFDPAFATNRMIVPETHNKASEGHLSTTGGSLFSDVHVMPGTVFIGRMTLHDVTEPELLAVLYSLITSEEIGGRSRVYGTIKIELLGIRCGCYSATTSLDLADYIAGKGLEKPSEILGALREKLYKELGFTPITNREVLSLVNPAETHEDSVLAKLWESSIEYTSQMVDWIKKLKGEEKPKSKSKSRSKK